MAGIARMRLGSSRLRHEERVDVADGIDSVDELQGRGAGHDGAASTSEAESVSEGRGGAVTVGAGADGHRTSDAADADAVAAAAATAAADAAAAADNDSLSEFLAEHCEQVEEEVVQHVGNGVGDATSGHQ
jgi:hypothetical protein